MLAGRAANPTRQHLPCDRDDLLELLGNLLDNAWQWAATTVRLTASVTERELCLRVEDDGAGCPPEQMELLQQRGRASTNPAPDTAWGWPSPATSSGSTAVCYGWIAQRRWAA